MKENLSAKPGEKGWDGAEKLYPEMITDAVENLNEVKALLDDGAEARASVVLGEVIQSLPRIIFSMSSPRLTQAENIELQRLQAQAYTFTPTGSILHNRLDEHTNRRRQFLLSKGMGKN